MKKKILFIALVMFLLIFVTATSGDDLSRLPCYDIGVKFGTCSYLSMKGHPCPRGTDIIVPERCRGKAETQRGIEDAIILMKQMGY
jgi:hypothetical protein